MDRRALGVYRAFRAWSGRPRSWGPSDQPWRVWFGGQVVAGLCDVLDELQEAGPLPELRFTVPGDSAEPTVLGPVSYCGLDAGPARGHPPYGTVHLDETASAALAAKEVIDRSACGGFCSRRHEVVEVRLAAPAPGEGL